MIVARDDIKPAFENRNIPVVMVADENYLPFLEVTARSIVANTPNSNIDILVLHANIPQNRCNEISDDLSEHKNLSIRFVDVSAAASDSGLSEFSQFCYVTVSTCFKLLAPVILSNFGKAILLDIDIAVNHDLTELFETDLCGNIFAGVRDGADLSSRPQFVAWAKQNRFEELDRYINAGVLIVNFDAYRKEQLINTLVPVAIAASKVKWYNEQDAINFCCKDKIKLLDPLWNVQVGNHCIKRQLEATGGEAYIAHFNTSRKPWNTPEHMMTNLWWRHAADDGIRLWRAAFGLSCEEMSSGDGIAVSVIVPVYNAETYLAMTLVSLQAQTLRNIEIICVNDGSTDNSAAILSEFSSRDPRVKVITQKNSGGAIARNRGIEEARGRWLFFADADDFCRPDMLSDMIANGVANTSDVVVAGYFMLDQRIELSNLSARKFCEPQVDGLEHLATVNWHTPCINIFSNFGTAPWNKLYRTAFINRNGIRFHQTPPNDDVYFVLAAFIAANKLSLIPNSFYYYRSFLPSSQMGQIDRNPTNFIVALKEVHDLLIGYDKSLRLQFSQTAIFTCFNVLFRLRTTNGFVCAYKTLLNGGLDALTYPDIDVSMFDLGRYSNLYHLLKNGVGPMEVMFEHCISMQTREARLSYEYTELQSKCKHYSFERDAARKERNLRTEERDKARVERDKFLAERDAARLERNVRTEERDKARAERNKSLAERDAARLERNVRTEERDKARAERNKSLAERDAARLERNVRTEERDKARAERDKSLAERDAARATRDKALKGIKDARETEVKLASKCEHLESQLREVVELINNIKKIV